jgi:hypothetical protein
MRIKEVQEIEMDDEDSTLVDVKKKNTDKKKDPASNKPVEKDKKKEDEKDIEEGADWDWDALGIAKGLSHLTHAKQYKHAAQVVKDVIAKKKVQNGGRLKKTPMYYVSTIAKQYSGVDTRKLAKMLGIIEGADMVNEKSGDKEAYQKFFQSALKKFGVKSPAELDDKKEKEFYNYIDKNWESEDEGKGLKEKYLSFSERSEIRVGDLKAKIQQYKTTDGMTEADLENLATRLGISVVKLRTLLDEEE